MRDEEGSPPPEAARPEDGLTYYFLSDLHLANGDRRVEDTTDPELLHRFLRYVRDTPDARCVIAGDAFELWQAGWRDIYAAHEGLVEDLFDLIESGKAVYAIGNHDATVREQLRLHYRGPRDIEGVVSKLKDEYHESYGFPHEGQNVEVVHGDLWDRWNHGPLKWVGQAFAYVGGLIERAGWYNVEKYFGYVERALKHFGGFRTPGGSEYVGDCREYVEGALDWVHRYGEDVVLLGHTHRPGILRYDEAGERLLEEVHERGKPMDITQGKLVVNTGSCVEGALDVVVLKGRTVMLERLDSVVPAGY